MDALSSIDATSYAASTAALQTSEAGANVLATTSANESSTVSVLTIFSDFTRSFLLQQANRNSVLSLDTLAASNPFSPVLNNYVGGQLYTSAGVLQQYATSLFMNSLENNQSVGAGDTNSNDAFTNPLVLSNSGDNGDHTLLNILNTYSQIAMLGGLSASSARATALGITTPPVSFIPKQTSVDVFA